VERIHDLLGLRDEVLDHVEAFDVDRAVALQVDGGSHATDEIVRVGILAAENRVDLDDFLLPFEGFEVVGNRHQVGFRGKLVGGMTPVGIVEKAKLAGVHILFEGGSDIAEISGAGLFGAGRNLLCKRGGGHGIGLQRGDDVHPVESVQVIEVDDVILHHLGEEHDVANDFGIFGDSDAEGIFDATHGGNRVNGGANAADAFAESPGVARVAALEDDLQAAPHGAGRHGVADVAGVIEHGLDAEMPFNASNGINNDACSHRAPLFAFVAGGRSVVHMNLAGILADDGRDEVGTNSNDGSGTEDFADRIGSGINAGNHDVGKPLIEGAVVPETGFAAADAAMAGADGEGNAIVPFKRGAGIVGCWTAAAHFVEAPALASAVVVPGLDELAGVEEGAAVALIVNALAVEHFGTADAIELGQGVEGKDVGE